MNYSTLTFFLFLSFLFHSILATGQNDLPTFSLTGKWENKQMDMEYEFFDETNASFSQMSFGTMVTYTLDTTKTPQWLDLTMKQGSFEMKIPCLLKIVHQDTIWIEQFPPYDTHPTEFSSKAAEGNNKIHVLTRNK